MRELREQARRRANAQELMVRCLQEALMADAEIDHLLDEIALGRETDRMV